MSSMNGTSTSLRFLSKVARSVDLPTGLEPPEATAEAGLLPEEGKADRHPGDLAAASAAAVDDTWEGEAVSTRGERPGTALSSEPSLPRSIPAGPVVGNAPPEGDPTTFTQVMGGGDHGGFRLVRERPGEAVRLAVAAETENRRAPAPRSPLTGVEASSGESAPLLRDKAPFEDSPVNGESHGERDGWERFQAEDFHQAKQPLRREAVKPLFSGRAATGRGGDASPRAAASEDATQPWDSPDRIREDPAVRRRSRAGGEREAVTPSPPPEQGSPDRPGEREAHPPDSATKPSLRSRGGADGVVPASLTPQPGPALPPGRATSPPPLRIRREHLQGGARREPGAERIQERRPGTVKIGRINIQLTRGKQPEPEAWPEPPAYADHVLRDEWEWSCHYLR